MQSTTSKVAVVLVALAVSAVLFVALSDGGTDDPADTEVAVERDDATVGSEPKPAEGKPEKEPEPKPEPKPDVPEIVIEGGQPVGGLAKLEFRSGETIRFDVVSDTADELHVHTYDVYVELEPGKTAEVKIPATIEGVVEAELHHSLAPVAEISIVP